MASMTRRLLANFSAATRRLPFAPQRSCEENCQALHVRRSSAASAPHDGEDGWSESIAMERKSGLAACHNVHAVAAIAPFIGEHLRPPRLLVFGVMKDKNVDAIADILFPLFDCVIATEPYPPRSAAAVDLASTARARGIASEAEREPSRAIERALRSGERTIFIGGSLYLAGAAIQFFDAQRQERSEEYEGREEPRA